VIEALRRRIIGAADARMTELERLKAPKEKGLTPRERIRREMEETSAAEFRAKNGLSEGEPGDDT
jgi:hypothetical protein